MIDDQYGLGFAKPLADHEYLREALDAVEAGERVRGEVERFAPDRVVVTLYEGGHYQHDVASLIASPRRNAERVRTMESTGGAPERPR